MSEDSRTQQAKRIIESRVVKSKRENYILYELGIFGNQVLTWNSYKEILASGWGGDVCMRSRTGTLRKNVRYNIPLKSLEAEIQDWIRQGLPENSITFNQSMPDEKLTLQGELRISPQGLDLNYTLVKKPMNIALKEKTERVVGIQALHLIRKELTPSSFGDLQALVEMFPDSVFEFSSYGINIGNIPNRNTIVWEVRNY